MSSGHLSLCSRPEVFNRGSATPRGSVEVLQGVRQIISSIFSLFQKFKTSNRLHKHKHNVKIAFYSLKIILPMSLHAVIMATYALLATFSYLVPKDVTCHNHTI